MILGREPENEAIIREQMESHASMQELRAAFLGSNEFRENVRGMGPAQSTGFEPPLAIERVEDRQTMQRLLDHIAASWSHYGETDPHWSVLTEERFRKDSLDDHREAFDALGKQNADRFLATLSRNGLSLSGTGHCIELGCGVGRITRWLAPLFEEVIGARCLARTPCAREGIRRGGTRTTSSSGGCQHRGSRAAAAGRGVLYVSRAPAQSAARHRSDPRSHLRAARVRAVAYVHLPTFIPDYHFDAEAYLAEREDRLDMEMHMLQQRTSSGSSAARHGMFEVLNQTNELMMVADCISSGRRDGDASLRESGLLMPSAAGP